MTALERRRMVKRIAESLPQLLNADDLASWRKGCLFEIAPLKELEADQQADYLDHATKIVELIETGLVTLACPHDLCEVTCRGKSFERAESHLLDHLWNAHDARYGVNGKPL